MELSTKSIIWLIVLIFSNNVFTEDIKTNSTPKPNKSKSSTKKTENIPVEKSHKEEASTEYYYISTTKETFDICEFNSTCNLTDLINATESELLTTNYSERTSLIKNDLSSKQFCTCDLQVSSNL